MAKKAGKIYLGYEEETITEKNITIVNYTVNKIGGLPVSGTNFIFFEHVFMKIIIFR